MNADELSRRQRRVIQRSHRWHDSVGKDHMGRPIYAGRPDERRIQRTQKKRRFP